MLIIDMSFYFCC
ncbi:hypothetical protein Avbf_04110 [Armadillidium vulgare]|nr:hypothetical protein Avbf_04110 [Armadillidium vulgare]